MPPGASDVFDLPCVLHENDVKQSVDTTYRPSAESRMGTDLNIGVVKVPPYARLVQRRADIEKPHFQVQNQVFQNQDELRYLFSDFR